MNELKLSNTILLAGVGICSVAVVFVLGNVLKHILDKVA